MSIAYIGTDIIQVLIMAIIFFSLSVIFTIFSPLGVFFIVFSIIRGKTKAEALKTVSFVFQIILASLTCLLGSAFAILIGVSRMFYYSNSWILSITIFCGVGLVVALEIAIIVWQSHSLKHR